MRAVGIEAAHGVEDMAESGPWVVVWLLLLGSVTRYLLPVTRYLLQFVKKPLSAWT